MQMFVLKLAGCTICMLYIFYIGSYFIYIYIYIYIVLKQV